MKTKRKPILALALLALGAHTQAATDEQVPGIEAQPASYFYTGKPYDTDAEAYKFAYRSFSPMTNRWTTTDPSGFPDGANNTLYVNNLVIAAIDPFGKDIVHLNNVNSVQGFGHSGALVGNSGSGYDYYSYGPKSSGSGSQMDGAHFDSLSDAFRQAKQDGYTRQQTWNTDQAADDAARNAVNDFRDTEYDSASHNCWDMVDHMLNAANVDHVSGSLSPNMNFKANSLPGYADESKALE